MSHHDEDEEKKAPEPPRGVGPEKTHEATTPPGTGDTDEQAVEQGRDKLDQAGGGH